jgi:putative oxidoreductase
MAADPPAEGRAASRLWHTGRRLLWPAGIRCAAAVVFLIFGVSKFVNHAAELASFRHYPVPAPGALVYAVGVIEIGGGLLLLAGLLTRLAALALAADMLGAIVVSGLARWEIVSLTLAPVLLAAMIILIRVGAGDWSLDRRLAANIGRRAAFQLIFSRHPSSNPGHSGDLIGRDRSGRSAGLSRRPDWRCGHCA